MYFCYRTLLRARLAICHLCYYNTANLSKVRPNVGNKTNLYALCFGETLQGWFPRITYYLTALNMHINHDKGINKQSL